MTYDRLLKDTLEDSGCTVRFRNRRGKFYVTVDAPEDYPEWSYLDSYKIVQNFFPTAYMTSGGYLSATFRLNP